MPQSALAKARHDRHAPIRQRKRLLNKLITRHHKLIQYGRTWLDSLSGVKIHVHNSDIAVVLNLQDDALQLARVNSYNHDRLVQHLGSITDDEVKNVETYTKQLHSFLRHDIARVPTSSSRNPNENDTDGEVQETDSVIQSNIAAAIHAVMRWRTVFPLLFDKAMQEYVDAFGEIAYFPESDDNQSGGEISGKNFETDVKSNITKKTKTQTKTNHEVIPRNAIGKEVMNGGGVEPPRKRCKEEIKAEME